MKVKKKRAIVVSFCNHKGGVGKTCSTSNIGAGLAMRGKKTLMVDLDPQANLTSSFGVIPEDDNIYQVISGNCKAQEAIINIHENLDIIPGTLDLAGAEIEIADQIARESIVKDCLEDVVEKYDYVLIDCPPSLGIFTMNGLVCSDQAIVPLSAEPFAIDGVENLMQLIKKVRTRVNKSLKVGGVLITRFDKRKNLNKDLAEVIESYFKEITFSTKIRDNISLVEANHQRKDIFRYNPKCNGAEDYGNVCDEILKRN